MAEQLDDRRATWFGDLEIVHVAESTGTILRGVMVDQPALFGVIGKIRDLGLTLISIQRLDSANGGFEMMRIERSITLSRPVDQVFAFMTDLPNLARWQLGTVEMKEITPGPVRVGTRVTMVRLFLGQCVESNLEITDLQPNKSFAMKTIARPMTMRLAYSFESVEGGTRLGMLGELDPKGFLKLAEPVATQELKRQLESNLDKLKRALETEA
ncbi:MAG: SRPBCC family protein [Chloroflexi bacterium]|nr:SRPBCC family protein [Chloroflexota bacterium]